MKRYNGLLQQMSRELGMNSGPEESDLEYSSRIIYTALGAVAYASLQDRNEEADLNSIVHFKRRVRDAIWSYIELYPELRAVFMNDWDNLSEEIFDIFLTTGQVYHSPNRISSAAPCCSQTGTICFVRGTAPDFDCSFSGLGRFAVRSDFKLPVRTVNEMFGISSEPLPVQWEQILSGCRWLSIRESSEMEYHRITPPFHHGFWTNVPEKKEGITLARTGIPGSRIYYLYRKQGKERLFCQLPAWMTDNFEYRTVAVCCLFANGSLPAISYHESGSLVYIHFKFLLPPPELNFLRLYSWPTGYAAFPHNFHRIMDAAVFEAFRGVLESIGYQFTKSNGIKSR